MYLPPFLRAGSGSTGATSAYVLGGTLALVLLGGGGVLAIALASRSSSPPPTDRGNDGASPAFAVAATTDETLLGELAATDAAAPPRFVEVSVAA